MKTSTKMIIFTHLYNDFSGSPCVLKDAIDSAEEEGVERILFTSQHRGFLSDLGVKKVVVPYFYAHHSFLKLCFFLLSQAILFVILSAYLVKARLLGKRVEVVVNTILPFSALWAGKLFAHRTVSYVHEFSVQSKALTFFLKFITAKFSDTRLYVSDYLKESYQDPSGQVVLNGLRGDFPLPIAQASHSAMAKQKLRQRRVLFVGSLRDYKGFWALIEIAHLRPNYAFDAVINASITEYRTFCRRFFVPENVNVILRPSDLSDYYRKAAVLLNLSDCRIFKETFGMTILEGFSFACPAIVPSEGGHHSFCHSGNSVMADVASISVILTQLDQLLSWEERWLELSRGALETAHTLSNEKYRARIKRCLLDF